MQKVSNEIIPNPIYEDWFARPTNDYITSNLDDDEEDKDQTQTQFEREDSVFESPGNVERRNHQKT
jgi:hypothetical protein